MESQNAPRERIPGDTVPGAGRWSAGLAGAVAERRRTETGIEGVTGWSIGEGWESETNRRKESEALYDKLENGIMPLFYGQPTGYARIMRSAIALNGSFFNAQRMMLQYLENAHQL
jgi:glucan phosphorylase